MKNRFKKLVSFSLAMAMLVGSVYKMPVIVANADEASQETTTDIVEQESETISGAWWTDWTKGYEVSDKCQFEIDVKGGANNWNNLVAVFTNKATTGTMEPSAEIGSGYGEYAVFRTDCWGWGNGDNFNYQGNPIIYNMVYDTDEVIETTDINGSGTIDKWDDFVAIMQDVHIVATITNLGEMIMLEYVATGANGHGFTYNVQTVIDTSSGLYVFFVCDDSEVTVTQIHETVDDTADAPLEGVLDSGLKYKKDAEVYYITGYVGEATSIVIPEVINGLPVGGISNDAFAHFEQLESVELPDSITYIGERAFFWMRDIKRINLPEGLETIGAYAFAYCAQLENIDIPSTVDSIGEFAFEGCSSFTSIELPEALTVIDNNIFGVCTGLKEVYIPESVTTIENRAFWGCSSLETIELPKNLQVYGQEVLSNCESLKEINISDENEVFDSVDGNLYDEGCKTLIQYAEGKKETYFVVPDGVEKIGIVAFGYCEKLTNIELPEGLVEIDEGAFTRCDGLVNVMIPDTVTKIGKGAFLGCTSLNEVIIPGSIEIVSEMAFQGCENLGNVKLQEGVTIIGNSVFENCISLKEISIPSTVTEMGTASFIGCELEKINVSENNTKYTSVDGNLYNKEGTILIQYAIGKKDKEVVVPDGVEKVDITAFYNCQNIESVTLPEGLTEIGGGAFSMCSNLETVNFPSSLVRISGDAFYECSNLKSVNMPSVKYIEAAAFYSCISLESIVLPEGLLSIGNRAFGKCEKLNNIEIPNSVTNIGDSVFWWCISLTDIELPNSVTNIGDSVFWGCISLTDIELPAGITSIEESAFYDCYNLEKIVIPKGVTEIDVTAIGYGTITDEQGYYTSFKNDNLEIYGYKGSVAEEYANNNGFKFVEIKESLDSDTDVSVEYTENAIDTIVSIVVELLEKGQPVYEELGLEEKILDKDIEIEDVKFEVFDITLVDDNNKEVQPDDYVTVKLPCSEGFNGDNCKVYHIDDNGKVWDMAAEYREGYMSFITKHFSVYLITETELEVEEEKTIAYGDTNGDGKINVMDAVLMKKQIAGFEGLTINLDACDVNVDSRVNVMDAVMLLKYIAGFDVVLGTVKA